MNDIPKMRTYRIVRDFYKKMVALGCNEEILNSLAMEMKKGLERMIKKDIKARIKNNENN